MAKTVVGLFNTTAEAQHVKSHLTSEEGYEASNIRIVANELSDEASSYASEDGTSSGTGVGSKIKDFFSSLTGGDDHAHEHFATGVNQGGALLTVTVPDDEAQEVAALLREHGARDIDANQAGYSANQSASSEVPAYGQTYANTSDRVDTAGMTAVPIVEEELVVGKREVDRGGVRVYSHLVERPVEADVTLRDEFINVERRAVNRPATAADFAAGTGNVIELHATGEEAVVGKTSRVTEEVLVGKQSSQHTEEIRDSVRKTEVDVEQVPAQTVATGYSEPTTTRS